MTNPNTETATFGAGCYWNSQRAFAQINGVLYTVVGYMDGIEVVNVHYDPAQITYAELIEAFWGSHDPPARVGEVPAGERSAIFVDGLEQAAQLRQSISEKATSLKRDISTEIHPLSTFTRAPENDQHYHEKVGK